MRTIGPFLPSGRRSASTSSGGSLAGSDSSRRTSATTAVAYDDAACGLDAVGRLVDEHHVGVAAVGQLEAAVAPHGDDRDPARRRRRARAAARTDSVAMSSVACSVASVSRLRPCPTTATSVPGHEVAARDPQQLAAAYGPHRPTAASGVSARSSSACISAQRGLGAQRDERLPQHLHALRLALEQVGRVARGAEDDGEPLGDLALVAQHREVPRRAAQALADPAEAEQPGVRVGRVGEPLQHHRQQGALDVGGARDPARQRLEVAQRGLRVGVAERGQPGLRRLQRQPRLVAGQLGDRAEQRAVEELLVQPAHLAPVVAPLLVELGDRLGEDARSTGRAGAATPRRRAATCVRRSWCSWIRCSSVRRNA